MLKCLIIEDQAPAQRILKTYISEVKGLLLVGTFADPTEALVKTDLTQIDVIFLDIHLPGISGIDFAKKLPKHIQVIFTTAFKDFALESYELNAIDYLLKPFSFERFSNAVNKLNKREEETIFIRENHSYIQLKIADILYIKADSDYTEIHTFNERFVVSNPLKHWELELNDHGFFKVHRSYLINLAHIHTIQANEVTLISAIQIPVGRTYKSSFLDAALSRKEN